MANFPRPAFRTAVAVLLLFPAGWVAGRLLQGVEGDAGASLPALQPSTASYDSSVAYLHGDLSEAASRLLPPTRPEGSDGLRTVALLRAADWRSCEDLGRQLRELQRDSTADSVLLVWTEPADLPYVRRRMRREHIPAAVTAGPALDSVFVAGFGVPTPAILQVSEDRTRAEGIGHTRRLPNVRPRSFAEELQLLPRYRSRPASERALPGAGS